MIGSFTLSDLSTERGCRRAFNRLLAMCDEELAQQDIAVVNLLCATDLPSADPLDIPQCLRQLDEWAEYARQETINGYPRFQQNPDPNKGSENVFRLWALMHAIRIKSGLEAKFMSGDQIEGFEIIDTSMEPTGGPHKNRINSQVGFIHGLLSPRCLGCCASNPVLFAAIGRRLGYPVKLVLSVQHIFNRWVDDAEQFNMDGSMKYIGSDEDHHYIDRFRPWRDWERKSTAFHRPLTPREELAAFMYNRCGCECANMRFDDALASCKIAARFHPDQLTYTHEQDTIEGHKAVKQIKDGEPSLAIPPIPRTPVVAPPTLHFSQGNDTVDPFMMQFPTFGNNGQEVEFVFIKKEP
jgi:hypothetical protein